ncbi:undecaprenyl-diphosphate phosphatase [Rubrobacter marinus]|uniref:undecaprenyl-diphosphate phosphatase n=1 Tax=Rubrobacter marinus TaxID=2653852 RepID=UPI00224BA1CC|nr:undecaprenyl-diphosphate phosphatase [Rubrobacter marinus]
MKAASESMGGPEVLFFLAGFASSAIVGYLAIKFLLNYLSGHSLNLFAYYRFALAALVAALLLLGA